jgi:hypothetical protein
MFNWLLGRKVVKVDGYKVISTRTKFIVKGNGVDIDMPKDNDGNSFVIGNAIISINDRKLTVQTENLKIEGIE